MIKAIIFDCWGTLFTNSQSPHPFEQFANKIGHTMSDGSFVKSFESHLMQDSYDDLSVPIKALLEDLRIPYKESELKEILIRSIPTQIAYPDTMENLLRLKKKYTLVLLTNSFKQGYEGLDKKFGISAIFDHIVTSFDAHRTKPDIKLFKDAIASTRVSPSEIVMVGDNLHDDVEPASSLGLHTILLDRKGRYPEVKNRVTRLEKIQEVIDSLVSAQREALNQH
jgi:2-haloalkanoic acid dehalogenase type II